jgi:hypothetical protein
MHPRLPEIRETCLHLSPVNVRLRCLRDRFQGETAIILGCGPSLKQIPEDVLRKHTEGKLVIALKQAYLAAPELCDIHLVNRYKYSEYSYKQPKPVVIASYQPDKPFGDHPCDILLPLVNGSRDFQKSLSVQGNLNNWTLGKRLERCCGPGILFELGFFVAEYLGISEVVTLGVDLNREPHFYADDMQVRGQLPPQLHGTMAEYSALRTGIPLFATWLHERDIAWKYVLTAVETPLATYVESTHWA